MIDSGFSHTFAPRYFQPRRHRNVLALRYDSTSIGLSKGLFTLEQSNILGTQVQSATELQRQRRLAMWTESELDVSGRHVKEGTIWLR